MVTKLKFQAAMNMVKAHVISLSQAMLPPYHYTIRYKVSAKIPYKSIQVLEGGQNILMFFI